jgi:hypothetical protein
MNTPNLLRNHSKTTHTVRLLATTATKSNLSMGLIGMEGGPPGWTVSTIYFTIEVTIGWQNAIPSYMQVEDNKANMRKQFIATYSDFKF